ncbi:hypothetical protein HDV01_003721 [Terramyces sp. JEL0728]|nr:hypothetical protein HDV01_003721 [Terramyces sp. JEL0728]
MPALSTLGSAAENALRMFYIVDPAKTTFLNLEDVPDYISEAVPFFIATITIEGIYYIIADREALEEHKGDWNKGKWRVNDTFTSIASGSIQQLFRFFIKGVEITSYVYVWENFRLYPMDPTSLTTWFTAFLAADCAYYWFHRLAHEVNIMWAGHVVHHSSEYYNQSTALRQSFFQPFTSWMFYLPAALFIPPPMFAVHKQLTTIYQYWIHSETIPRLGWLEYIVNTPSAHRVHHGRNPYCIDKNYAGTLIIWDRMFGTYQDELVYPQVVDSKDKEEKVAYGLTHPINTFNPITVQIHHLKHVFTTAYNTPGFTNKLKVFFYGPGWHEGTPRLGDPEEIPKIDQKSPPVKYDPPMNSSTAWYTALHSVALVGFVDFALLNAKVFPNRYSQALAGWIFIGFYSVSKMMENKKSATAIEFVRMATGLGLSALVAKNQVLNFSPSLINGLRVFYGASGLYMGYKLIKSLNKQKKE